MNKETFTKPVLALVALAAIGGGASLAAIASAQTATTTTTPSTTLASTSGAAQAERPMGHAPMGQDGVITAISGTSISMQEEADEGGAVYTVDASNASISKDGTTSTLAGLAVGDKIFVDGTLSGTSVAATSIRSGHGGRGHGDRMTPPTQAPPVQN